MLKSHSDKVVHVVQLRSGLLCSSSIDCTIRVWTWITPDKASSMHALIVGPCLEPSLYKKRSIYMCTRTKIFLYYSYAQMYVCVYVYIWKHVWNVFLSVNIQLYTAYVQIYEQIQPFCIFNKLFFPSLFSVRSHPPLRRCCVVTPWTPVGWCSCQIAIRSAVVPRIARCASGISQAAAQNR